MRNLCATTREGAPQFENDWFKLLTGLGLFDGSHFGFALQTKACVAYCGGAYFTSFILFALHFVTVCRLGPFRDKMERQGENMF